MVDVAKVNMYGHPVGTFSWDGRYETVRFEYDHGFIGRGLEPSPLMMPVREGRVYSFGNLDKETFRGLPGMLADSLPDTYGRALFDRWLALTGRTSGNPIETLCFLGKRCMGALEFEPALDVAYDRNARFEIDTLVDVARDALSEKSSFGVNLNDDRKAAIAEILRLGTSAGGQRAKAIIAYNKVTGEVRSGQVEAPEGFDYYLIKLDGVSAKAGFRETENFGRLEYSFYKLARACGIEMTDCSLVEENGRAHFLTKRFDRKDGRKVHMQTLCGIAHYDYRLHRAYDHTKNISFLMGEDGRWRLSPAYDMGYAYNPLGGWTSTHQMSINGKYDDINRKDLLEFASLNNIKNAPAIIDEVCEAASGWAALAWECEVPVPMVEGILPNMLLDI